MKKKKKKYSTADNDMISSRRQNSMHIAHIANASRCRNNPCEPLVDAIESSISLPVDGILIMFCTAFGRMGEHLLQLSATVHDIASFFKCGSFKSALSVYTHSNKLSDGLRMITIPGERFFAISRSSDSFASHYPNMATPIRSIWSKSN